MQKLTIIFLLFLFSNNTNAQDYSNAELGLPNLNQVAPIDKNAEATLVLPPFLGMDTKSWGSTDADTLMYIFSIADIDFAPLADGIDFEHYLHADRIFSPVLKQEHNYTMLEIDYRAKSMKAHPFAKIVKQEILDLANMLVATDSRYQLVKGDYSFDIIYDKHDILGCHWEKSKYDDDYPIMVLNIFSKPRTVLANEGIYAGKYPTAVANNDKPQVWQYKGGGKTGDSYERFNGIFKEGFLISGTKTFHGYGAFYDGVWSSNAWINPVFYGKYDVSFIPEGSADTIYGTFYHGAMGEFALFYAKDSHGGTNPAWVRNTYDPYKKRFDELVSTQTARNATRSSGTQYDQNNSGSSNSSSGSGRTYSSSYTKCSVCNGKGYTEYDCGQGGGHPCRKYCSACNGTGQVHN